MFKKIIMPIDLQDLGDMQGYLAQAAALAQYTQAELRFITVLPGYSMSIVASYFPADAYQKAERKAEKTLADFISQNVDSRLITSYVVKEGRPHVEINAEAQAWGADIIVMPSRVSSTLPDSVVGSVAQRVAERACCSVMILRA